MCPTKPFTRSTRELTLNHPLSSYMYYPDTRWRWWVPTAILPASTAAPIPAPAGVFVPGGSATRLPATATSTTRVPRAAAGLPRAAVPTTGLPSSAVPTTALPCGWSPKPHRNRQHDRTTWCVRYQCCLLHCSLPRVSLCLQAIIFFRGRDPKRARIHGMLVYHMLILSITRTADLMPFWGGTLQAVLASTASRARLESRLTTRWEGAAAMSLSMAGASAVGLARSCTSTARVSMPHRATRASATSSRTLVAFSDLW
jgi:hypothetical protein